MQPGFQPTKPLGLNRQVVLQVCVGRLEQVIHPHSKRVQVGTPALDPSDEVRSGLLLC